jgi:hypothetical protein
MGLYLRTFAAGMAASAAWQAENGACDRYDLPCMPALGQAMQSAAAESQQALVRLATTTSDADAYALAMSSCRRSPGESPIGNCALLSAAQWARIEPDNAVPWLYLAAEAVRRRDASGLDAALYRASQAQYSDRHQDLIPALVASDEMTALPPPIQVDLTIMLLGIQATSPAPGLFLFLPYCGLDGPIDANRTQICGDLAAMLIERGRSEIDGHFGTRIGEQLGWAAPRLAALRDAAEAMEWQKWQRSQKWQREDLRHLYSCETLQSLRKNLLAQVQLGQSGRLRQEFAASGLKTSQAAEQWRAEKLRRMQLGQAQMPAQ